MSIFSRRKKPEAQFPPSLISVLYEGKIKSHKRIPVTVHARSGEYTDYQHKILFEDGT